MRVTVVVPAYNASEYIERTLQSVRRQTHTDIEIIVVDDGSTDATRSIIERVMTADQRLRIISVPNGGVARARNIGIDAAKTDLIAFIDADDLWHPEKISRQVDCLGRCGPDYAACYAMTRIIDVNDCVVQSRQLRPAVGYILCRHLYAHFVGNGSSLLVRRRVAQEVGGFEPMYADADIGGCEDLDFELKLAARYLIAAVPSYLVGYREYEGNMSSNRRRMAQSVIATTRRHLEANPTLPRFVRRYALSTAYHYMTWLAIMDRNLISTLDSFGRLLLLDPKSGFDFAARAALLVLKHFCSTHAELDNLGHKQLPLFYDMSPDEFSDDRHATSEARMKKLGDVDYLLWRRKTKDSIK
jgi:glycosyltransferase involved in cell wall biosynthesis